MTAFDSTDTAPALAKGMDAAAYRPIRARLFATLAGYGALALATCFLAPLVGSTHISFSRVFDRSIPFADNVDAQIFFVARMPRVLAGAVVGAALASAGVVLQALLRNPLATPFTLGVSAGAALGAMLAISFGATIVLGPFSPVPLASFAGAVLAASIVYGLATKPGRAMSTSVLLLAGVTLNSFFSALILFVQYISDFTETYRTVRWLMGDLDIGSFAPVLGALPLLLAAFAIFAVLPSSLNLLSVGADVAATRGVDVARTQRLAFVSSALATSAAVSLAGPIGFVGIVVPHLVRLMVGVDHRIVLPASALFGAAFLVACDLVARTVLAPVEVPVGIVTALLGGPFFLWLLVQKKLIVLWALLAITGGLKAAGYPDGPPAAIPRPVPIPRPVAGDLQVSGARQVSGMPARRVVSVVPSLTEMLFVVGAGPQVVGVGTFDNFPPETKTLPRVGALIDPDVERILSLRPDLVMTYGSQGELESQLARAHIRTFQYRHGGVATILQTLRDIGRITGHAAEGERQARVIEGRLNAIREKVRGQPRPRTLLVFGRQPKTLQQMYVTGGDGFLDELLDIAGGVNVFADIARESVQPSHELLLVRAPEVIVELRAAALFTEDDEEKETAAWSALPSIPAVRNRRIHLLHGDYFVIPGPRIAAAVEEIARVIHPNAFR